MNGTGNDFMVKCQPVAQNQIHPHKGEILQFLIVLKPEGIEFESRYIYEIILQGVNWSGFAVERESKYYGESEIKAAFDLLEKAEVCFSWHFQMIDAIQYININWH